MPDHLGPPPLRPISEAPSALASILPLEISPAPQGDSLETLSRRIDQPMVGRNRAGRWYNVGQTARLLANAK